MDKKQVKNKEKDRAITIAKEILNKHKKAFKELA